MFIWHPSYVVTVDCILHIYQGSTGTWLLAVLLVHLGFPPLQHLRSYKDGYPLVVAILGSFIGLPHWENSPLTPYQDFSLSNMFLLLILTRYHNAESKARRPVTLSWYFATQSLPFPVNALYQRKQQQVSILKVTGLTRSAFKLWLYTKENCTTPMRQPRLV